MKELKIYFKTMWFTRKPLFIAVLFFMTLSCVGETPEPYLEIALKAIGVTVVFFTIAYFLNKFKVKI